MAIVEAEVRTALGIDDEGDPVAAIANMRADIAALKDTIAADPKKAASGEMADMRRSLTEANRKLLTVEADFNNKIATLKEERRQEQARAKVDGLMARGKITKANEEAALDLALNLSAEKFDAIIATMQSVDLTERGVASGSDLADFEPTPGEIAVLRNMGAWDDKDPAKSRLAIMRQKAAKKGVTLPVEA